MEFNWFKAPKICSFSIVNHIVGLNTSIHYVNGIENKLSVFQVAGNKYYKLLKTWL
jgi:hypothetical protein